MSKDTFTVEGTEAEGFVDLKLAGAAAALSVGPLGTREQIEAELDVMLTEMRDFWALEPDMLMRISSAFTARLTELSVQLHRVEGRYREYRQIRTMQIERMLAEMDRQFKLASRIVEVRRQDLEMSR